VLSRDSITPLLHHKATYYGFSCVLNCKTTVNGGVFFFAFFDDFRRSDAGEAHEASGVVIKHDGDWPEIL
jgi:hypothetical protein